jgi:hypothetical protein
MTWKGELAGTASMQKSGFTELISKPRLWPYPLLSLEMKLAVLQYVDTGEF